MHIKNVNIHKFTQSSPIHLMKIVTKVIYDCFGVIKFNIIIQNYGH